MSASTNQTQRGDARENSRARVNSPEIVLIDGPHSPHLGDFGSNTNELETNVSAGLNGQALMVSELRWCGIRVIDTGLGDGLVYSCQSIIFGQRDVRSACN